MCTHLLVGMDMPPRSLRPEPLIGVGLRGVGAAHVLILAKSAVVEAFLTLLAEMA